ncbi:uncharacterized protein ASCRUDRAFT_80797 [Ascoidea rubescens DSM 1968]|uniref:Uncharacterized protein n=1 Tax=Ascoidea rubescens DSM 1968 TaxID=1344418 RepID=A0A1D2VH84_9ASCO|nr:hypothetical protein ASCRUDRAFT_80797 [Ascoidea rubescens DSM 1968]ODV61014.1 hypothetical protein ASCRUDRAFT_80797 [Ascoidea rubescens DSM 1968]
MDNGQIEEYTSNSNTPATREWERPSHCDRDGLSGVSCRVSRFLPAFGKSNQAALRLKAFPFQAPFGKC